uniref:Uncharacterized protein n=1 Tax=Anguilla anguilla TaxID=7936 RepID=A0A0E9P580_ANGAN
MDVELNSTLLNLVIKVQCHEKSICPLPDFLSLHICHTELFQIFRQNVILDKGNVSIHKKHLKITISFI